MTHRRFRVEHHLLVVAASLLLAIAGSALVTPRAHAAAEGCSIITSDFKWGIPYSSLCFEVDGRGTKIEKLQAAWYAPNVCNWRIDWVIYYQGRQWWRDKGANKYGCRPALGLRTRDRDGYSPHGSQICAELFNVSRGNLVKAVCHFVYR